MTVKERVQQFEKDHEIKVGRVYINCCLAGIEEQGKAEYVEGSIEWEPNIEPTWLYITTGPVIHA